MKNIEPVFEQHLPATWTIGDAPDLEHGHEMEFWVVVRLRNGARLIRRFWYVNFYDGGYTDEELEAWDGRTDSGGEPFLYVGWCREGIHPEFESYYEPVGDVEILAYAPVTTPRVPYFEGDE
ncbi:hypothetical protein RJ142_CDS0051 [Klebsiella phage EKq1]|nr:hypothetical protein RJ142_CDS0051 [Klebsiella phage EKq1]